MQRVIVVYNPRSSKHLKIQDEVIKPLKKISGILVGKFEVEKQPVEDNVAKLKKILVDGDLVIVAGGDGTATVGLNAAAESDKNVTLGILGYGNFNDFSRMLGEKNVANLVSDFRNGKTQTLYPLVAEIDGKHWRYVACYFTAGMFAESTALFDEPKIRKKLKKGKRGLLFSVFELMKWYFKNKRREFLPGKEFSDVLFVNSPTVAKMMKSEGFWVSKREFLVSRGKLTHFFSLLNFMIKSIFRKMPGEKVGGEARIEFAQETEFMVQAEGEYMRVRAKSLIVRKDVRGVNMVCRK